MAPLCTLASAEAQRSAVHHIKNHPNPFKQKAGRVEEEPRVSPALSAPLTINPASVFLPASIFPTQCHVKLTQRARARAFWQQSVFFFLRYRPSPTTTNRGEIKKRKRKINSGNCYFFSLSLLFRLLFFPSFSLPSLPCRNAAAGK